MKLRTAYALLFFLLFSAIGEAQNAANVAAYLGPRYELPAPAGQVRFVFQNLTLERAADGKATYGTILKQGYFADGGNYGPVQAVIITDKGGKSTTIQRERTQTAVPADPVRPRTLPGDVGGGSAVTAPDSASMAESLDRFKDGVRNTAKTIGPVTRQLWETWMWLFWDYILPGLGFIGILLLFIAGTAKGEALISMRGWRIAGKAFSETHSWSSFLLACDLGIIALTLLAHFMFYLWVSTQSVSWMLVAGLGAQWIFRKIVNWLIPNLPVAGTKSGEEYTGDKKQARLPG